MHGQKQIYMFLMFIIFIMAFHFCRKAIKRDKEMKQQRDDDLKRKIDANIIDQKLKFELLLQQQEIQRQQNIIYRLYEHKDKCFDLYIFGHRPEIEDEDNKDSTKKLAASSKDNSHKVERKPNNNFKTNKNNTFFEPINYLFILVLIYFLIKAITDIKQHYKMKNDEIKPEANRRYSLQNYAERKNLKVNHPTIFSSFENRSDKRNTTKFFEDRSLIGTMPGTVIEPRLSLKSIANNKTPLLRRCSVPILSTNTTNLHRSSIDSINQYDSNIDIKRRVRMIQRH